MLIHLHIGITGNCIQFHCIHGSESPTSQFSADISRISILVFQNCSPPITVHCGDRHFELGQLYDIKQNMPIPGHNVWEDPTLINFHQPHTFYDVCSEKDLASKLGEHGMSVGLGGVAVPDLLAAGGSAGWLCTKKSSQNTVCSARLCRFRSGFQWVSSATKTPNMQRYGTATHYVAQLHYGADAICFFQCDVNMLERRSKIKGKLEFLTRHIQNVEMEAAVSSVIGNTQFGSRVQTSFFGDFLLGHENRLPIDEAVQFVRNLPERMQRCYNNCELFGVPKTAVLLDLNSLDFSPAANVESESHFIILF